MSALATLQFTVFETIDLKIDRKVHRDFKLEVVLLKKCVEKVFETIDLKIDRKVHRDFKLEVVLLKKCVEKTPGDSIARPAGCSGISHVFVNSLQKLSRRNSDTKATQGCKSWDCALEQSAQDWSDRCEFDPSYPDDFGEIYDEFDAAPPMKVAKLAMKEWWRQLKEYDASSNPNMILNDDVYEYAESWSQMVWGEATKIGCGIKNCTHDGKEWSVITCHYDHGIWPLRPVFELGNGCSADSDCTTYADSTCDTSSKLCNSPQPVSLGKKREVRRCGACCNCRKTQ
ncbi:Ancylostoma secreted protein [Toxocara canis]|uniref:Ancylostoma secreted protein n=1 Tax=Toxocara canis TaxID=6265 RepID=A0A0B2VDD3_TOXCA|nr:Ancylostoma secreted protein [Toxocara canis]